MPFYQQTSARRKKATQHVFIAVPTYGPIDPQVMQSIHAVKDNLISNDVSVETATLDGNCHVDDARNDLCRMFLESECTHLFFWDADVFASAQSVHQMLGHGVDMVAGLYPYKNDLLDFPVKLFNHTITPENNLISVAGVPTGFLLLSRNLVQAAYDKAKSKGAWVNKGDYGAMPVVEIFHRGFNPQENPRAIEAGITSVRMSGDYQFSYEMRELGYKVWVDPNLTLGHIGKKAWIGNVGRYWLEKSGQLHGLVPDMLVKLKGSVSLETRSTAIISLADAWGNKPYALDPFALDVIWQNVMDKDIKSLFETGSGVSTLLFALTGKKYMTLESSYVWAQKTEDFLKAGGLSLHGLRVRPIVNTSVGPWYDFDPKYQADFVLIDGPERTQLDPLGRSRIFDLCPAMISGAKVLMIDDADDGLGQLMCGRAEDAGFKVEVVKNPARRDFAMCTKE